MCGTTGLSAPGRYSPAYAAPPRTPTQEARMTDRSEPLIDIRAVSDRLHEGSREFACRFDIPEGYHGHPLSLLTGGLAAALAMVIGAMAQTDSSVFDDLDGFRDRFWENTLGFIDDDLAGYVPRINKEDL